LVAKGQVGGTGEQLQGPLPALQQNDCLSTILLANVIIVLY